ncbi:conserved hypothetical protein [Neospora caninum Liverpool]|uniref:Uncharacterized protein n=1 Tax=Neospora caninum (strain Liverpool) TaxID=572307 RepID=F0VM80_NEOCL|nr:conserved hypothetical protein [Neospora caninum Liverpool]CBZ54358.1 conserved hypothetical protein [Neospora caninum Liverpool]CEL69064.1 TPA: hypothetical protein BN1204_047890 [Neospora caninum Liverpool]|eukprot:XP_003884389.1 conserved hypothetical protein [Neospora caninum Liverpool]
MATSRFSQLLSARGLVAAGLSFVGGWYCRQTLADVSRPPPRATPACVSSTGSALSASPSASPSAFPSASSHQAVVSGGTRGRGREGPSGCRGLLVTRRIVVPLREVEEFADLLNALANYNTRQYGFLSHSIYVHEVTASPSSSASSSGGEGNEVVALEILVFEEWADPLAAKAALKSAEIKNSMEQARRRGWDLRGEVWVGLAGTNARLQKA